MTIENKLEVLSEVQKASCNLIEGTGRDLGARIEKHRQDLEVSDGYP
jgi:hypothetical protein